MELLVDSHHGIYVPQIFVQQYRSIIKPGTVDEEDLNVVELGPDADMYLEAWEDILDNTILLGERDDEEYRLYQNEDLWAVKENEEIPEY